MHESVIIGMGNPLLSDLTTGLIATDRLAEEYSSRFPRVRFTSCYSGGLDLLTELSGHVKAIIIDTVFSGHQPAGYCHHPAIDEVRRFSNSRLCGSHGLDLPSIMRLGKEYGYLMPRELIILAIEGREFEAFSEQPSSDCRDAIPEIIDQVLAILSRWYTPSGIRTPFPSGDTL